jgi:hypothetical protein
MRFLVGCAALGLNATLRDRPPAPAHETMVHMDDGPQQQSFEQMALDQWEPMMEMAARQRKEPEEGAICGSPDP